MKPDHIENPIMMMMMMMKFRLKSCSLFRKNEALSRFYSQQGDGCWPLIN